MKLHYFSLSITNLLLTTPIIKNNWGQLLLLLLPPANLTCLIRQLLHNISHSDIIPLCQEYYMVCNIASKN